MWFYFEKYLSRAFTLKYLANSRSLVHKSCFLLYLSSSIKLIIRYLLPLLRIMLFQMTKIQIRSEQKKRNEIWFCNKQVRGNRIVFVLPQLYCVKHRFINGKLWGRKIMKKISQEKCSKFFCVTTAYLRCLFLRL